MRLAVFADSRVGREVVDFLASERREEIVALVVHDEDEASCRSTIVERSGVPEQHVFGPDRLGESDFADRLRDLSVDLGVSAFFGHILPPAVLEAFDRGCLNLHSGYLPYNRGTYPNVWSIVEGTPAGATLHYMDEGVDTGPVVARRRVEKRPTDTGRSLYRRLQTACVELFRDTWPEVAAGRDEPVEQDPDAGTSHRRADVEEIDEIDLDETYTGRELIDRLRARTFPPYESCYFEEDGERVYVRVQLWHEDEFPPES
ncbi:MAG: methionyl-tRNA formyltransferase [Bradymonadaceae bacterium]